MLPGRLNGKHHTPDMPQGTRRPRGEAVQARRGHAKASSLPAPRRRGEYVLFHLVQSASWLGRSIETQKTPEDRGSAL